MDRSIGQRHACRKEIDQLAAIKSGEARGAGHLYINGVVNRDEAMVGRSLIRA